GAPRSNRTWPGPPAAQTSQRARGQANPRHTMAAPARCATPRGAWPSAWPRHGALPWSARGSMGSAVEQTSPTTPQSPTSEAPGVSGPTDDAAAAPAGFAARGRMRRRARFLRKARELAYRDLGGLVFSLHRFGQRNDALVLAKLSTLGQIDAELRALESALEDPQPVTVLREAGITACPRCAAIHGSEDRFCPNCGLPISRHVDLPIAGPAAGSQAGAARPAADVRGADGPPPPTTPPPAPAPTPTRGSAPRPPKPPTRPGTRPQTPAPGTTEAAGAGAGSTDAPAARPADAPAPGSGSPGRSPKPRRSPASSPPAPAVSAGDEEPTEIV